MSITARKKYWTFLLIILPVFFSYVPSFDSYVFWCFGLKDNPREDPKKAASIEVVDLEPETEPGEQQDSVHDNVPTIEGTDSEPKAVAVKEQNPDQVIIQTIQY